MAYQKGLVATLAELEQFYKGQAAGDIIELMNQTNDIITDIPWMESNQTDGHLTRIRTGLPEVYWRRLYQGTPPSKSRWAQVKEGTGILEARSELDVEEVRLYGDKARAFRLSEGAAFMEAMRQKVAGTLFSGESSVRPDEFNGLNMRYAGKTAPNVLDAGGTGASGLTSLWLVSWGDRTVHGLYPKGSMAGLSHEDLGERTVQDDEGRKFEAFVDKYVWRCGLTVRDWRAVVRVVNVRVADLVKRKGEAGFIDLQALTVRAKNLMPEAIRQKAIWYMPSEAMTALELQSSDAGNVQLQFGEFFASKAVPVLHGRPVRQCDAIGVDEKALA